MGLLGFLFHKQRQVEARLSEYLDRWEEALRHFKQAMEIYLDQGLGDEFDFMVEETHKRESRADDLRRQIEHEMYAKALLPESRGDILGFLEHLDRVPNRAETVLFIISGTRVERPEAFAADLRRLVASTCEATDIVLQLARRVFSKNADLLVMVKALDAKESECDRIERGLIRAIFSSDALDDYDKLRLEQVVSKIGGISDRAMDVGDRLTIMSLKRRV